MTGTDEEEGEEVIQVQDDPAPECRRRVGRETRHELEKEDSKLNLHERSSKEGTNKFAELEEGLHGYVTVTD